MHNQSSQFLCSPTLDGKFLFLFSTTCIDHDVLHSNGKIVVIGGVIVDPSNGPNLAPTQQVLVYDTQSNTWTAQNTQPANGVFPSTRTDHSAVVSKYTHANNASLTMAC